MSGELIDVRTQAELDAAVKAGYIPNLIGDESATFNISLADVVRCSGSSSPRVVASGSSSPRVEAYDSSSPRVVASGSSSPRVEAYDSSSPRVVAYDSSSPRVEASGSSSPRVVASGSSSPRVEAYDSSSPPRVEAYGSSSPRVVAYGSSSPRVEAYDSSSPRVVASGSSSPRVEAYDSSSPRVEAYGSSSPRVEAYDSSSPRVEAYGSSSPRVEAYGDSNVTTQGNVSVAGGKGKKVPVMVPAKPSWSTPAEWCEYHGVKVVRGVALVFKAVGDDWKGSHKTSVSYEPGSQPEAPDWDGGKAECGKGLHFSPRPVMALRFCSDATHFLACKVRLADMAVHPKGDHPTKCKAAKVCAPCVEVDIDGEPIGATK